ncbi:MAG: 50S ribosome-binding GTPase [Phycisphaeraceae bacterium]|nr:50S ribosome-binding GTPase [Phycisphaeraceae bacterium]
MDTTTTIVAVATPQASSERALIRLSGPNAFDAIDMLAVRPVDRTRGVGTLRLRLPIGVLPTLAVRLCAPASYTGQDTVELLPPGSPTVVDALVRALLALPHVRHAEAGEFSARAYLSGRLTLEQAEGVAASIAAVTDAQLDAAQRLLQGQTGRRYAKLVDDLASALALVEAAADFAEEEHVVPIAAGDLRQRLDAMLDMLEREMEGRMGREAASARPLAVLAGAPNAGKTSLFNALLARHRAVVSPVEHATRDAIVEPLAIDHPTLGVVTIDLADLPGLPEHATTPLDEQERASVQAVIDQAMERADVVLLCDPSGEFIWPGPATLRLRTKADAPESVAPGAMPVSTFTGLNLDRLRLALAEAAVSARQDASAGLLPRHAALARRALDALSRTRQIIAHDPPQGPPREGELAAAEMRRALDALGELGGHVHPDEVLGRIFASFCIGK